MARLNPPSSFSPASSPRLVIPRGMVRLGKVPVRGEGTGMGRDWDERVLGWVTGGYWDRRALGQVTGGHWDGKVLAMGGTGPGDGGQGLGGEAGPGGAGMLEVWLLGALGGIRRLQTCGRGCCWLGLRRWLVWATSPRAPHGSLSSGVGSRRTRRASRRSTRDPARYGVWGTGPGAGLGVLVPRCRSTSAVTSPRSSSSPRPASRDTGGRFGVMSPMPRPGSSRTPSPSGSSAAGRGRWRRGDAEGELGWGSAARGRGGGPQVATRGSSVAVLLLLTTVATSQHGAG